MGPQKDLIGIGIGIEEIATEGETGTRRGRAGGVTYATAAAGVFVCLRLFDVEHRRRVLCGLCFWSLFSRISRSSWTYLSIDGAEEGSGGGYSLRRASWPLHDDVDSTHK